MSKPSYITNNFSNNNYVYGQNIRNIDIDYGINFSPDKLSSNFENYHKVARVDNDQIVYKTSGTKDTKGSKQNSLSIIRPDIQFKQDENRFFWNVQNNPNLELSYENDLSFIDNLKQGYRQITEINDEEQLALDAQYGPDNRFPEEETNDFILRLKNKYSQVTGVGVTDDMDDWFYYAGPSNILPESYPATVPIFEPGQSCKTQNFYHKSNIMNLPNVNLDKKPQYGSQQALPKYNLSGPRLFSDNRINTNTKKPFDVKKSGYSISIKESFQQRPIIDTQKDNTSDSIPTYSDLKEQNRYCSLLQPYECKTGDYDYTNNNNVYNNPCGSQNKYGSILEKNTMKPNLSKFVMHNIIGLNTNDINQPMIQVRNKSLFNQEIDNENSLNDLKKISHENYIKNTNQLRLEANKNLQTQTEKLQLNLSYR